MAHVFLGWPNRIDSATLTGGSWNESLPLANLQLASMAVAARSADATNASTKLNADLGAEYSLRAIGLFNHNLSYDAQVKISLGTSSGGNQVYAGAWVDAFPITFGSGADEWSSYNWWSPMADDENIRNAFPILVPLDAFYSARYVTIEIDDTTNTDGWVQMGRVFVGGGLYPTYNTGYGMQEGYDTNSETLQMESGSTVVWPRRVQRNVRMALEWLSQDSEFGVMFEMMRRASTHGEVLYLPDTADRTWSQRSGFLGRMRQLSPISYPLPDTRAALIDLVEVL